MYNKSITYIILSLILLVSCKSESLSEDQLIAKAKAIHERVITLDTHCDINVKNFTDSLNYTQDLDTQITLPKMTAGGLDVAWFIVYTGQDTLTTEGYSKAYENAMSKFEAIHRLVEDIAPNEIELALTSNDVRRIDAAGKKVAMIGIENGYPIGLDINNIEKFYNLGGRYMSLAHNGHSQLSDSHTGEASNEWLHNGLSELGKEVIKEMNRLGMMIDVSHPSKESMRQMITLSKAPIIASHSAARTVSDESRNLDDEQLEWLKENGGVVQTVALDSYVNKEKVKAREAELQKLALKVADSLGVKWYTSREAVMALNSDDQDAFFEYYRKVQDLANKKAKTIDGFAPAANVADFVDHIDYMVKKIGIDHVGISSDFDGGGGIEGWSDASETFNVTLELVRRGYTEAQIGQLWSGNLLRVLDEVEAVAKTLNQ